MKINKLSKIFLLLLCSFSFSNGMDTGPMKPSDKNPKISKKQPPVNNTKDQFNAEFNYDKTLQRTKEYIISQMQSDKYGYIDIPNLPIGQSGIVVNKQNIPIVIAIASVVESDEKRSKLEFKEYNDLEQEAIPTSRLKVSKGDSVVLKYLYDASIVIAPNVDGFHAVRNKLNDFSFLHPDLFASFLKVEEQPVPTKELFEKFTREQNLGSLVIVIEKKAYLIDARTFKIVDSFDIKYSNEKELIPFYTRVEKIEEAAFDFGADSIGKYTKYYKELLDIK